MSTTLPDPAPAALDPAAIRADARALVETGRLGAEAFGRPDRAAVQAVALERIDRPETLIAVIGEFKQGKSSLVNALLSDSLAAVDDDLATATLTLFRYGARPTATLIRRIDGNETVESVALDSVASYVSEQTNRDNALAIERVEIATPNAFLASGATIVDTPGFGGLAPGSGGMTLAYLHAVDAVLFVSDASAPLSRPELQCLERAVEACPAVILVLAKTDLYPAWRQIEADDTATLEREQIGVPVLAVSSSLMAAGAARHDAAMQDESGIPALREVLDALVLDVARLHACRRGLDESRETLSQLTRAAEAELAAVEDPSCIEAQIHDLGALQARLERLRGPGAKWGQVLGDGFSDLVGDAEHRFRSTMREVARQMEQEIEDGGDPGRKWPELSASLRERVGTAADRLIEELESGAQRIQAAILELLADEEGITIGGSSPSRFEAAELWAGKPLERLGVSKATDSTLATLRGGQSGISTLNVIAGLAGISVSVAATAGIGLLFGGKQILDERKRHLQAKRQQARTAVRTFTDDVQFEAGKRMRDLSRDLQRAQRDYFSQRILELQRTASESLAGVQAALQKNAAQREAAATSLRQRIDQLRQLENRIDLVEGLL